MTTPATALSMFDLGEEFDEGPRSRLTDTSSMSEEELVHLQWPEMCRDLDVMLKTGTKPKLPPLLSWSRDGHYETFEVGVPGKFVNQAVRVNFPEWLCTARGAETVVVQRPRKGVLRISLSHYVLPDKLEFDPEKIPTDPYSVYFGELSEGSDLTWNLREQSHGLFGGKNGAGKSTAIQLALMQLHLHGWRLVIFTPYPNDPTYADFAALGHEVHCGTDDRDFERVDAAYDALSEEFTDRARERGEAGADWYLDEPSNPSFPGWQRQRTKIVWEESENWMDPRTAPNKFVAEVREKGGNLNARIAKEGRKLGMHQSHLTQQPVVGVFGSRGGEVMRETSFRMGVRHLDPQYYPVMFPSAKGEQPAAVVEVLADPDTPPGRCVSRGAARQGSPFSLNDIPGQIAWCSPELRKELLGLAPPQVRGPVIDTVEAERRPLLNGGPTETIQPPPPSPMPAIESGSPIDVSGVYWSSQLAVGMVMLLLAVILVRVVV